jgi:hypothetical protein
MNVLNRLLGLLLLLLLLALALVTLGLTAGLLTVTAVAAVWPYAPVEGIVRDVVAVDAPVRWYVLGGAIVAALLALAGLKAELSPPPRRARLFVVPTGGPGRTEVAYGTLDDLAAYSAGRAPGVERVRARVERRRDTLAVRCRALISPFADLTTTGTEIERRVAADLGRMTGVAVAGVRVRATVQEGRARRVR